MKKIDFVKLAAGGKRLATVSGRFGATKEKTDDFVIPYNNAEKSAAYWDYVKALDFLQKNRIDLAYRTFFRSMVLGHEASFRAIRKLREDYPSVVPLTESDMAYWAERFQTLEGFRATVEQLPLALAMEESIGSFLKKH